jgi:RNA ligase
MTTLLDLGITKAEIDKEIAAGYISVQKHPAYPLYIYNYTAKTQFEGHWNKVTKICRGLIVDDNNFLIAVPMMKFFNANDPAHPETDVSRFPKSAKPIILEKMDGSLGILWTYGGDYGIATRGSFTSPQAVWATAWLKRHVAHLRSIDRNYNFTNGLTQCFEIIYRQNRIVCDYDFEGLILLAMVRKARANREVNYKDVKYYAKRNSVRFVRRVPNTIATCLTEDRKNQEGYVVLLQVTDSDGYIQPTRVKIKHPTYVRLHKLITGFNPKDVWEMVSTKMDTSSLLGADVPTSFKAWFAEWEQALKSKYVDLEERAKNAFSKRISTVGMEPREARKALAAQFLAEYKDLAPIMFQMLDGNDYSELIWDYIKPKGTDTYLNREELVA